MGERRHGDFNLPVLPHGAVNGDDLVDKPQVFVEDDGLSSSSAGAPCSTKRGQRLFGQPVRVGPG